MWVVVSNMKVLYQGGSKADAIEMCSLHQPDGAMLYKLVGEE